MTIFRSKYFTVIKYHVIISDSFKKIQIKDNLFEDDTFADGAPFAHIIRLLCISIASHAGSWRHRAPHDFSWAGRIEQRKDMKELLKPASRWPTDQRVGWKIGWKIGSVGELVSGENNNRMWSALVWHVRLGSDDRGWFVTVIEKFDPTVAQWDQNDRWIIITANFILSNRRLRTLWFFYNRSMGRRLYTERQL